MLEIVRSGELSQHPPFDSVPHELLRLNDIALSGDAEPTTLTNFSATIAMIARVKPPDAKIVLITDAGGLDRADVKRGLEIMDANNGEVWAKLDAGTEDYFNLINRTKIPFGRILKNIGDCAKARPVVIQSLFMKVHGVGPSADEITAYCQRLREIIAEERAHQARAGVHHRPQADDDGGRRPRVAIRHGAHEQGSGRHRRALAERGGSGSGEFYGG